MNNVIVFAAAHLIDRCRAIAIFHEGIEVILGAKKIVPAKDDLSLVISLSAGPRSATE